MTRRLSFLPVIVLVLSLPTFAASMPDVELSGFGRLVGGYLNDSKASYEGYEQGHISFSEDSLLGLQGTLLFNDQLSTTVQLLAHTGDDRKSGVEWAYLTYQPFNSLQVKVGRMRTPFYALSDVIDVGFAYPYITPPQQIYTGYTIDRFEGLSASYQVTKNDWRIGAEIFTGDYADDITVSGIKTAAASDNLVGLVLTLAYNNLELRSMIFDTSQASFDYSSVPGFQDFVSTLSVYGFDSAAEQFAMEGSARVYQASIEYDNLRYFARGEWIRTDYDFEMVPILESYYLTSGISLPPLSFHLTYARSNTDLQLQNKLPQGTGNPLVEALSSNIDLIIQGIPKDDLESWSLGARWDINHKMALKSEATWLNGQPGKRAFFDINEPDFDRKAILYTVALEWVF